jgi:hypothetical protein
MARNVRSLFLNKGLFKTKLCKCGQNRDYTGMRVLKITHSIKWTKYFFIKPKDTQRNVKGMACGHPFNISIR